MYQKQLVIFLAIALVTGLITTVTIKKNRDLTRVINNFQDEIDGLTQQQPIQDAIQDFFSDLKDKNLVSFANTEASQPLDGNSFGGGGGGTLDQCHWRDTSDTACQDSKRTLCADINSLRAERRFCNINKNPASDPTCRKRGKIVKDITAKKDQLRRDCGCYLGCGDTNSSYTPPDCLTNDLANSTVSSICNGRHTTSGTDKWYCQQTSHQCYQCHADQNDATTGANPACGTGQTCGSDGLCVTPNVDCAAQHKVVDPATKECVICLTDSDCAQGHGNNTHCDTDHHVCTSANADHDASSSATFRIACNPVCSNDEECSNGSCVPKHTTECSSSNDCTNPNRPVCSVNHGTCGPCTGRPDLANNGCPGDKECKPNGSCQPKAAVGTGASARYNECAGVGDDSRCPQGMSCYQVANGTICNYSAPCFHQCSNGTSCTISSGNQGGYHGTCQY